MARSGGRGRDLPERLGDYRSAKGRYYRWIWMGVLDEWEVTHVPASRFGTLATGHSLIRWCHPFSLLFAAPLSWSQA